MCYKNILYNVNRNITKPGLECSYIDFVEELDEYLLSTYPKHYLGLQLYQDDYISNIFHVIASYNDVPGLYQVGPSISDYISNLYDSVWGNSVERTSVFSYLTSQKILSW